MLKNSSTHSFEETKEIGIVYDRDANLLTVSNAAIDTLTFYVNVSYTYRMQMKLELVAVPVSDVVRAKAFYTCKHRPLFLRGTMACARLKCSVYRKLMELIGSEPA